MESLKNEIIQNLDKVETLNELKDLKVKYLGKKGEVTSLAFKMREMSNEEKREYGKKLNDLRGEVNSKFDLMFEKLNKAETLKKLEKEKIDITLPGTKIETGYIHPITKVINELEELFISMGYEVVVGPEIEVTTYNFDKLNLPDNHPARDERDSFFLDPTTLLRTQTSPVQVRTMEKNEGPIRIICPGKVYRRDSDDATHSHQFTQLEGLVIGENISMSDLKGTLEEFAKKMFGNDREVRFRPSFFPFTEPSLEVDISCFNCGGKGCNICKGTGWIEILGSGMVHPNVLKMSGYDPEKYQGFAFGMGPERIAMLKYGIKNIRDFYTNDLRFIKQFDKIEGEKNESK